MHLCFYSDELASNFLPIILTRPLDDVRIGIFTIAEKWIKTVKPESWIRQTQSHLASLFYNSSLDENKNYLWINSRLIPSREVLNAIKSLKINQSLTWNGSTLCTIKSGAETLRMIEKNEIPKNEGFNLELNFKPLLIEYFWDLLNINGEQIEYDLSLISTSFDGNKEVHPSVVVSNPEKLFIHESSNIEPGCILIADDGPIYIGASSTIEAGAILRGPVAICENSVVKMGARIFAGTTIGPVCKVGGEVNNCIFHSYSNKTHEGFAGNSIIGQWCNFGADTNTSNLKNNYSKVRLPHWDSKKLSEKSVQFFGTVFGDFSKTAINTSLNTGTVCGVSSNIFSSGFPPKIIPSFSWLGDTGVEIYDFDKAIAAMKAMMERRGIELTPEYISMMRHIFQSENAAGS